MVKAMTDIGDGVVRIDYPTIDGKLTSAQYYYAHDFMHLVYREHKYQDCISLQSVKA